MKEFEDKAEKHKADLQAKDEKMMELSSQLNQEIQERQKVKVESQTRLEGL